MSHTCEHINFECDTNICTTKCEVHSIYCDSIHDFDYLKFDFMMIKYMKITELKLKSEFVHVNVKIQVVSNNAEKKLSILSKIISHLNQNVSNYEKSYNDFNINYIQVTAAATDESSKSLIININKHVIDLQTDNHVDNVMTDYFLSLECSF